MVTLTMGIVATLALLAHRLGLAVIVLVVMVLIEALVVTRPRGGRGSTYCRDWKCDDWFHWP